MIISKTSVIKSSGLMVLLGLSCSSFASVPPPPSPNAPSLSIFDGPGLFCAPDFYIRLKYGEFVITRKGSTTTQVELEQGRLLVYASTSGLAEGRKIAEREEGALYLSRLNGETVYEYSGDTPGVSTFSAPNFGEYRRDKVIFDRLSFVSPRSYKVDDEPCMASKDVK